jgi:hypothetical protein
MGALTPLMNAFMPLMERVLVAASMADRIEPQPAEASSDASLLLSGCERQTVSGT